MFQIILKLIENFKYRMVSINIMTEQINLRLSTEFIKKAREYSKRKGYSNLQEFIKNLLRERLFEKENVGGVFTYNASEKALSKNWLTKEEDKAWAHLQKEK